MLSIVSCFEYFVCISKEAKTVKEQTTVSTSRAVDLAASDRGLYHKQEKWIEELKVEEVEASKISLLAIIVVTVTILQ